MRCKLVIVAALVSLIASQGTANAQTGHVGEDYDYVRNVVVDGNTNYLYVSVPGNLAPTHGCAGGGRPAFARSKLPVDQQQTQALMQLATASFLARSKIHLRTISGQCAGNYPIFDYIQLFQ